jgi:acyl-CoA reductase-like NAD-dependent aldehyde dehydrogenase
MRARGARLFGRTAPSELPTRWASPSAAPSASSASSPRGTSPSPCRAGRSSPPSCAATPSCGSPPRRPPRAATCSPQCLWDAGSPPGVLNVVHGFGEEVGAAIVAHPDTKVLTFTGSTAVGRASPRRRPHAQARLPRDGRQEPRHRDARRRPRPRRRRHPLGRLRHRGAALHRHLRSSRGRRRDGRCSPKLVERAKAQGMGDPADPASEVGPLISEKHQRARARLRRAGGAEGGTCAAAARSRGRRRSRGWFYPPTVVDQVKRGSTLAMSEVFGPVLAVIQTRRRARRGHRDRQRGAYGLSSSIYTRDVNLGDARGDRIEAGITYVNAPPSAPRRTSPSAA